MGSKRKQRQAEEDAKVGKAKFQGFICIIIAIATFVGNKNLQEAVAANKKLAAWIQDDNNCPALDWSVASIDDVPEGCYYWNSDFKITADITDDDMNAAVLPETMSCNNIVYDRWVDKFMTYDAWVCPGDPHYRSEEAGSAPAAAKSDAKVNPKTSWKKKHDNELLEKVFAAQGPKAKKVFDKKPKNGGKAQGKSETGECYSKTVTDWGHGAETGWEFPSSSPADQGHQTVWSSPAQHSMVPTPSGGNVSVAYAFDESSNIDLHFNFPSFTSNMDKLSAQIGIGSIFALAGDSFEVNNPVVGTFYNDTTLESQRNSADNAPLCWEVRVDTWVGYECTNSYPLCFSDSGIQHWLNTSPVEAGLTTAEFQALPYYGNTTDFPSCLASTEGDYRVRSYCRGGEHSSVFVIAGVKKETIDGSDYLTAGVFTDPKFPDTEAGLEVAFFAYMPGVNGETGEAVTKDKVMVDYIKALDDLAGASAEFSNGVVGFFGIIGLLMMGAKAKKISSSSS